MKFTPLFCIVMASVALMSVPAHAAKIQKNEKIDFSVFTCHAFLDRFTGFDREDASTMLVWIDGYLAGVSSDTVLDFDNLEKYSEEIVDYCKTHGNRLFLEAARMAGVR